MHLQRGQSSPGYLQVGHVPSKWTWQMPQTSSSGMSQRQVATAFHFLILTFISVWGSQRVQNAGWVDRLMGWSGSSVQLKLAGSLKRGEREVQPGASTGLGVTSDPVSRLSVALAPNRPWRNSGPSSSFSGRPEFLLPKLLPPHPLSPVPSPAPTDPASAARAWTKDISTITRASQRIEVFQTVRDLLCTKPQRAHQLDCGLH